MFWSSTNFSCNTSRKFTARTFYLKPLKVLPNLYSAATWSNVASKSERENGKNSSPIYYFDPSENAIYQGKANNDILFDDPAEYE